eukprot:m.111206 g.111206  ORF g.111206 m.111206 type:complete len:70 (+) comp9232_c6_seq1:329-538(+)
MRELAHLQAETNPPDPFSTVETLSNQKSTLSERKNPHRQTVCVRMYVYMYVYFTVLLSGVVGVLEFALV